jgi:hypothetical protein
MVAALHNLKKIFAAILPSWRGYQLEGSAAYLTGKKRVADG